MVNNILNKYLINNFQTIEFNKERVILKSSNSNLLNVTLNTKLDGIHSFFLIVETLINEEIEEEYFEGVYFEKFKIAVDIIFSIGNKSQMPFIVIIDKTKHYEDIKSLIQVKNEVSIENQKTKLLYNTLFDEGKIKNEFLESISHDLKTPIHSIVNLLDIFDKDNLNNEQKGLCRFIYDSSKHLNRLISDIYDLASIETNSFSTNEQEFSLFSLLNSVEKIYLKKIATKSITFKITKSVSVPDMLIGDSSRVLQVLINILDNAFKSENEGFVELKVQKEYKKASSIGLNFIINNNAEYFKFGGEMLSSKIKTKGKHIEGLGLSIVYGIVEKLKGSISFESENDNGTTFKIYLPFQLSLKAKSTEKVKPFKIKKLRKKHSILIVDDNEINNLILMKLLINHGNFYIDNAPESRHVIKMLEKNSYDLIILDLYLSEINGFELINLIRNHKKEQVNKVKIIPMSAGVKETDKKIILENNIPSLLNKPFTAEDLYSEIYKNI